MIAIFSALKKDPRRAEIIQKLIDEGAITSKDIVNTSFRKKELSIFKILIDKSDYWKTYAAENGIGRTRVKKRFGSLSLKKMNGYLAMVLTIAFQTILQRESHVSDVETKMDPIQ